MNKSKKQTQPEGRKERSDVNQPRRSHNVLSGRQDLSQAKQPLGPEDRLKSAEPVL